MEDVISFLTTVLTAIQNTLFFFCPLNLLSTFLLILYTAYLLHFLSSSLHASFNSYLPHHQVRLIGGEVDLFYRSVVDWQCGFLPRFAPPGFFLSSTLPSLLTSSTAFFLIYYSITGVVDWLIGGMVSW